MVPQRPERAQRARARGQAVPRQQVLPRLSCTTTIIVGSASRARSRAASYWFNQHVIDNVLNYTGRGAQCARPVHVRLHRPKGCRRSGQRHRDGHRRSPAARCARSRPVACSSTHSCSSLAVVAVRRRRCGSSPKRRGISSMHTWFDSWALTLVVFIPAVGAVIMMLIPRAEEEAIKWVAAPHDARDLRRHDRDPSPTSTTTTASTLQFNVNKDWIDVINSHYHVGRRRHLAAAARAVGVHHGAVRHLLVEPLPRAAQPQGVPRADPDPRGRHERHVRRPGPDPVLHLLRDRAAPDVLHDRRVGRSRTASTRRSSSSCSRCSARR